MTEQSAENDASTWTDHFTYAGRCGHTITVTAGHPEPHNCGGELAEHEELALLARLALLHGAEPTVLLSALRPVIQQIVKDRCTEYADRPSAKEQS